MKKDSKRTEFRGKEDGNCCCIYMFDGRRSVDPRKLLENNVSLHLSEIDYITLQKMRPSWQSSSKFKLVYPG